MRQESIVWPLHPHRWAHAAWSAVFVWRNERLIDLTLTHGSRKFCSAQTVGGGDVVLGAFRNIYLARRAPECSQCLQEPRLRWEPGLFQVSGDNGSSCEFTALCVPLIHSRGRGGEEKGCARGIIRLCYRSTLISTIRKPPPFPVSSSEWKVCEREEGLSDQTCGSVLNLTWAHFYSAYTKELSAALRDFYPSVFFFCLKMHIRNVLLIYCSLI